MCSLADTLRTGLGRSRHPGTRRRRHPGTHTCTTCRLGRRSPWTCSLVDTLRTGWARSWGLSYRCCRTRKQEHCTIAGARQDSIESASRERILP
jgi:hypothetical protein